MKIVGSFIFMLYHMLTADFVATVAFRVVVLLLLPPLRSIGQLGFSLEFVFLSIVVFGC